MADRELRLGMRLLFSGGATTLDPETLARVREAVTAEIGSRLSRLAETWNASLKPEDLRRLNRAALDLCAFMVGIRCAGGKLHIAENRAPNNFSPEPEWSWCGTGSLLEESLRFGMPTCTNCLNKLLGVASYCRIGPQPPPPPWNKWWVTAARSVGGGDG